MCRFVPLGKIDLKSYAALYAMRCVGPHSTTSWVTMLRSAAQAHHSKMHRTAQPKQAAAASGLAWTRQATSRSLFWGCLLALSPLQRPQRAAPWQAVATMKHLLASSELATVYRHLSKLAAVTSPAILCLEVYAAACMLIGYNRTQAPGGD